MYFANRLNVNECLVLRRCELHVPPGVGVKGWSKVAESKGDPRLRFGQ